MSLTSSLKNALAITACAFSLHAAVPPGWSFGSQTGEYECSIDPEASYNGQPSTYIRSKEGVKATLFGSMMQQFTAAQYTGKRIRLSANLKSAGVEEWGGLWMRVDDANHPAGGHPSVVAFDNMHDGIKDRSITGTKGWQNYSVVLNVPEGATAVSIGFLLHGTGALWVNGIRVDVVGPEVPVTGKPMAQSQHDAPVNLSFDK